MMPGRIEYAKRMYSETKPDRRAKMNEELETAFEACSIDGEVTVKAMAEYMGLSTRTIRKRVAAHGDFWILDSKVERKGNDQ